jgi:hypothetical protein
MKLYYNKITGVLGASATATTNVQKLTVKRYQDVAIELIPVSETGVVELFATGSTGLLVVKAVSDFTGGAKILDATWDAPTVDGRGYIFDFVAVSTAIDAVLGALPSLAFALEIVIVETGKRIVLPTISLVVENNYYREGEPVPVDPDPPYPLPGELLVKSGNLAGLADKAVARGNLDISGGALINKVAAPASSAAAGQPGDFAASADYLYVYTGTGIVHAWLRINGATEF